MYELTSFFKVPKSSYLSWKARHREDEDTGIKKRIEEIFEYHKKRYGYRRITATLHQEGLIVNHKGQAADERARAIPCHIQKNTLFLL